MGAGKTTLGKELARQIGYEFCDLDWYIEDKLQKKISAIFADEGEEWFRKTESDMLREVCAMDSVVIAVGGGTPCFFTNMEYMNTHADTVYLKASIDTLIEHIHISDRLHGSCRPLLQGMDDMKMHDFISQNITVREPYYTQAKHIINIDVLRTEEQIQETAKKISMLL